jgi:hypothetical protein
MCGRKRFLVFVTYFTVFLERVKIMEMHLADRSRLASLHVTSFEDIGVENLSTRMSTHFFFLVWSIIEYVSMEAMA